MRLSSWNSERLVRLLLPRWDRPGSGQALEGETERRCSGGPDSSASRIPRRALPILSHLPAAECANDDLFGDDPEDPDFEEELEGFDNEVMFVFLVKFLLVDEMAMESLNSFDLSCPDVMSRQPTIIIGLLGHHRHGKTTLVNELMGSKVFPVEASTKLDVANAKIFRCQNESCSCSTSYLGHPNFLPTVLNAVGIIDGALLLVSAKETCGQPQTDEHLFAMEIVSVPDIIVIQSNTDAISKNKRLEHYEAIKEYVKDTVAKESQVLQKGANFMEIFCKTIVEDIRIPTRNLDATTTTLILQPNDVDSTNMHHGDKKIQVVYAVVMEGVLKPNEFMEIRPGRVFHENRILKYVSLTASTVSIYSDETKLPFAIPGGVISLHITVEPYLQSKMLVGHLMGEVGHLPDMYAAFLVNSLNELSIF
ncbi:hypothetical protein ACP4OV_025865 [Aristida adscensionis]